MTDKILSNVFFFHPLISLLVLFFFSLFYLFTKRKSPIWASGSDYAYYWIFRPAVMFTFGSFLYALLYISREKPLLLMFKQNILVQIVVLYALFDLVVYLVHFACHKNKYLFKMHRPHHENYTLSWENGKKDGWGFEIASTALHVPLLYYFAFSKEAIFIVLLLWKIALSLSHHNINFKFPFLEAVFVSPARHGSHHIILNEKKFNYAITLVIWDRIFEKLFPKK